MASYVTPKKNTAYKFYVSLVDQSNTKLTKANPTIASGDFKVSTDGAAFANLTTLPSANPASGRAIMIDLSAGEMNGDNIVVQCVDAAGAEWCDLIVNIQTSARQIDDLAYPATSGRSMVVDANGLVDATTVKVGPTGSGTAQVARDLGTSVLISSGSGTGQLDVTSGVIKANLAQILGTALSETSGQIAAAFKQFFDVGSPTGNMRAITLVTTTTTATNLTNAPSAGDFTSTMKTSLNAATPAVTVSDKTGFSLSAAGVQAIWDALTSALTTVGSIGKLLVDNVNATISSRSTYAGGDTSGTTTLLTRIPGTVQPQTGDSYARLGAPAGASLAADIAADKAVDDAIKAKTDNLPASPSAVGSAMTLTSAYDPAKTASQAGDAMALTSGERTTLAAVIWNALTSGMSTVGSIGKRIADNLDVVLSTRLATSGYTAPDNTTITAINAKTTNLPSSPAAVGSAMTLATDSVNAAALAASAVAEIVAALQTTALTESYAALHAAPTEVQLLFEIRAILAEHGLVGTTLTTKQINGSTTAEVFTTDSATAPTSLTRTA